MNGKKASKKEKQEKVQMEAGKCKKPSKENTRFVASCSTKKYPFSLFLKKFQKLKWNSGHRYVAKNGNIKMSRAVLVWKGTRLCILIFIQ